MFKSQCCLNYDKEYVCCGPKEPNESNESDELEKNTQSHTNNLEQV